MHAGTSFLTLCIYHQPDSCMLICSSCNSFCLWHLNTNLNGCSGWDRKAHWNLLCAAANAKNDAYLDVAMKAIYAVSPGE
jgi:hypothetical protein